MYASSPSKSIGDTPNNVSYSEPIHDTIKSSDLTTSDDYPPSVNRKSSVELFYNGKQADTPLNDNEQSQHEKSTDITTMQKALYRVKQSIDYSRSPLSSRVSVQSAHTTATINAAVTSQTPQQRHTARTKLRLQHVYELSQTQPVIDTSSHTRTLIHHAKSISDPHTASLHRTIQPYTNTDVPKPRLRPRAISTGNGLFTVPGVDLIAPTSSNHSSSSSTPVRNTPTHLNRFLSHTVSNGNNSSHASATSSPRRSLRTLKERIKSKTNTPKLDSDELFSPLSAPVTVRTRHNSVTDRVSTPVLTALRSPIVTITPTHQLSSFRRHTVPNMRLTSAVSMTSESHMRTPLSINGSVRSSSEIAFSSTTPCDTLVHIHHTYASHSSSPHAVSSVHSESAISISTSVTPTMSLYPTPKCTPLASSSTNCDQSVHNSTSADNHHQRSQLSIDTIASLVHAVQSDNYASPVNRPTNPFGLKLQLGGDESTHHSFIGGHGYQHNDQPSDSSVPFSSVDNNQPERGNLRRSATTGVRVNHNKHGSYDISQNGSLQLGGGYEIGRDGVVNVPFATQSSTMHLYAPEPLSATSATSSTTNSSSYTLDHTAQSPLSDNTPHHIQMSSPPARLDSYNVSARSYSEHTSMRVMQLPASLPSPPRMISAPNSTQSRKRQPSLGVPIKLTDLVKLGELGRGATGPVYKALYLPTLTVVALKSVRIDNKDERHQMLKELKAFHTVHSANILSFIGASFNDGKLTMVLEYMNRGSLDQVVRRHGALCESTIRSVAEQTLIGLQHLHFRHTVHRDIKPANILVNSNGTCKISDFGLLKQLDNTNAMCNTFVGTLMYLSPERVTGDNFSYPSDIWSLGLALIYCAQQSLPVPTDYWALVTLFKQHQAEGVQEVRPSPFELDATKFSADFCDFVRCCMRRDPAERHTATQLLQHPFIKLAVGAVSSPHVSKYARLLDTNLAELNKLVDAVLQHYYAGCLVWRNDNRDIARTKHIAEQLGCAESIVEKAFRDKFDEDVNDNGDDLVTLAINDTDGTSSDDEEIPIIRDSDSDDQLDMFGAQTVKLPQLHL